MQYPKVPQAGPHIAFTVMVALLVGVALYLINPALPVTEETSRFLSRTGALLSVLGAVLGFFGIAWSKENRRKLLLAQREIVTCAELLQGPVSAPRTSAIADERLRLAQRKEAAMQALKEAAGFDETVAKVSYGALAFLVAGTVLQAVAA